METTTYKPEKGIQQFKLRSETHDVTLHFKGQGGLKRRKPLTHIANVAPKPKKEAKASAEPSYEPSYAPSYGYASYGGGWGGGGDDDEDGYSSYASYNDWTGYTSLYSTTRQNQDGEALKITFHEQDYHGLFQTETAADVGAAATAVIVIDETDSEVLSKLFDSRLPSWKKRVEKGMISFILLFDKKNTTEEFVRKIAQWIGAIAVVSADIEGLFEYEKAREFFNSIADLVTATEYPRAIVDRFTVMEAARFLALELITKLDATKKISFEVDPVGNSLLHLAMHNSHTDTFFYLAEKFPHLINHANMFNQTVVTNLSLLTDRNYNTVYFDWRKFWTLPFDFTTKLNNFDGMKLESLPLLVLELVRNKTIWAHAKAAFADGTKLKQVLAALPLAFRGNKTTEEEALEALKLFIAEGVTPEGDPKYHFVGVGFLLCTKYFVQNGHKLTDRDIVHVFENGWTDTINYVIELPEFLQMSAESNEAVVKHATSRGWNDLLRKMAKKGIPLPLSVNSTAWLSSANIIARANARKVLSLKDLCVHAMYEIHGEQNVMKVVTESTPEEIQSLFVNSTRTQWVFYVPSEKKRRLLFKLYETLSRADREENAIQVTIEGYTFSFRLVNSAYSDETVNMWVDGLRKEHAGQHYKYKYGEHSETTGSLHTDEWTEATSDGEEVLKKIMKAIGWDMEDAYVFLVVLSSHMRGELNANGQEQIRCHEFFHKKTTICFHQVPAWYQEFIQNHYGLAPLHRTYSS